MKDKYEKLEALMPPAQQEIKILRYIHNIESRGIV
jgi:hypothetical protein